MTVKSLFPVLIGGALGLAFVAPYAISKRLIEIVQVFMSTATGVLTPYNTALFAKNDLDQQRRLFLEASKYCATIGLLAVVGLFLLSESFLTLWVGAEYADLWKLVSILAAGVFLPMVTSLANGILQSMAQHRCLALFGICNAALTFLLAGILGSLHGLIGACLAVAISETIWGGIAPLLAVSKVLNLSLAQYIQRSIAPAFAVVAIPALILGWAVSAQILNTWVLFVGCGLLFSLIVLGLAYFAFRVKPSATNRVVDSAEQQVRNDTPSFSVNEVSQTG